ncbi:hypothetical protein HDU93_004890, partial [Gonapodya sp. JEL0774]
MAPLDDFDYSATDVFLDGRPIPRLSALFPQINSFQNLETLSLDNCGLADLDRPFPPLNRLRKLSMRGNKISGGLEALGGLKGVEFLDLAD